MIRYEQISFTLPFFFLFPLMMFSQLPPNQITTMTKLHEMLQNSSGNPSFSWSKVNKTSDPCSWMGVSCSSSNQSVVNISLSLFLISSSEFLPVVCQIDSLESLDVSNNHLSSIPDGFISACGGITGLKLLNFSRNKLVGPLATFTGFQMLEFLDLSHNSLTGNVTLQLDGLNSLKSLNLSYNQFDGFVPTSLGKNNLLQKLQLSTNLFKGEIPVEMVKYGNLSLIDLSHNNLSGSIPDRLGELSRLQILVLSANKLRGGIPNSLANIQTMFRFHANQNQFAGSIPDRITVNLRNLDLSFNYLNGTIPKDLLSPQNLQSVDLSSNSLEGPIPINISSGLFRLRLGGNMLNGTIPSGPFGSQMKLTYLELNDNSLTGEIPSELGLCRSLALLDLAKNELTGFLPAELGGLTNLQVIDLQQNKLEGGIPDQFMQLHSLQIMNLSSNSINGSIPTSVSRLQNLTNLDLRVNNLSGSLPNSIGSLSSLLELQLGNNQVSGHIPAMPSSLQIALNLSNNFFRGPIPVTLSRLTALEVLDLSNNNFSGSIPNFLTTMTGLTQLVLSNNNLSGDIPNFKPYVVLVTNGNNGLRNTTPNAPPASSKRKTRGLSTGAVMTIAFFSGLVLSFMVVRIIPFVKCSSNKIKFEWMVNDSILQSSFDFSEAMKAVHTQTQTNIMLKSKFYTYYKASMPCGINYCIKKLYWSSKTFSLVSPEKFTQEVKILDQLRKTNIMIPVAYALSTQCAYLIYQCPQHGTLFDLLHGSDKNVLTWENRYSIAVGVSTGLSFIHGFCDSSSVPIVLLNLSTKSILMKSLSEPLIGDVELNNVINPSKSLETLSVIAGAPGYVPPEYAYTMRVTKSGNIFSFGTILLELLTGKQPVNEGMELAKWVMNKIQHDQFIEILDPRLSCSSAEVYQQMLSILRIAMRCVSVSRHERPDTEELQGLSYFMEINNHNHVHARTASCVARPNGKTRFCGTGRGIREIQHSFQNFDPTIVML